MWMAKLVAVAAVIGLLWIVLRFVWNIYLLVGW